MSTINNEYILGTNQTELERLEFQHGVWKNITEMQVKSPLLNRQSFISAILKNAAKRIISRM